MYRMSVVAAAAVMLSGAAALADEPTYEISGFPLTQHQLTVLNSYQPAEPLTRT